MAYSHVELVAALICRLLYVMVIVRHHEVRLGRLQYNIFPTSLRELFQPLKQWMSHRRFSGSCLRSHFNTREFDSREIGRFLGHSSEPVRS